MNEPTTADVAGKDTRTAGESTLSSDVLDLLTAIRDMANVPMPTLDETAQSEYHLLMYQRLSDLHIALDVALSPKWIDTTDPAAEAAYLRGRLTKTPVTYAIYQRPALPVGGEQA